MDALVPPFDFLMNPVIALQFADPIPELTRPNGLFLKNLLVAVITRGAKFKIGSWSIDVDEADLAQHGFLCMWMDFGETFRDTPVREVPLVGNYITPIYDVVILICTG
jgi:hypothetical protein